ncbi:unnamed protein product [Protopolystoma xenopodis]|uniref:Ras-associating domain-containing protein n=1 Tax=Protopolystoma xenopodis TaxID=117903 RepID=A0A3S5FFJ6_9PLAT|nr:unnamed protein product [Protopolystoma xenopodis]
MKIYGDQIHPDVPYKTLLLSVSDTASQVVREALDKYGLEDMDADAYCLVMRTRSASDSTSFRKSETRNIGMGARSHCAGSSKLETEEILADTDCPLGLLLTIPQTPGAVSTFEVGSFC